MVRLGVCGYGPWARLVHLPAVQAHPGIELSGVWTRRPEAGERAAAELGTTACADIDELIDRSDALALVVPPEAQPELAIRSARAGKHLILEKPIAATAADAASVRAAVDDAGVASLVCFTRRWVPAYAKWFAELGARADGRSGQVTMLNNALTTASGFEGSPWRQARGGLWDMGPHAISIVHSVLGEITEVSAMVGPWHEARMLVRHASGATSVMTVGISCPPTVPEYEDFGFCSDRGQERPPFRTQMSLEKCLAAQTELLDTLVTQIAGGARRHPLDVHLGEHVVDVLEAAERSVQTRTSQSVGAA